MTPSRSVFGVPWRRSKPKDNVHVDDLDGLRDAVTGDGLLLIAGHEGPMRLYTVAGGRARPLGTFTDPGTAWQALDAVEIASLQAGRCQTRP